jgi:hypothetical protein
MTRLDLTPPRPCPKNINDTECELEVFSGGMELCGGSRALGLEVPEEISLGEVEEGGRGRDVLLESDRILVKIPAVLLDVVQDLSPVETPVFLTSGQSLGKGTVESKVLRGVFHDPEITPLDLEATLRGSEFEGQKVTVTELTETDPSVKKRVIRGETSLI